MIGRDIGFSCRITQSGPKLVKDGVIQANRKSLFVDWTTDQNGALILLPRKVARFAACERIGPLRAGLMNDFWTTKKCLARLLKGQTTGTYAHPTEVASPHRR
jgi:hypothetical protein